MLLPGEPLTEENRRWLRRVRPPRRWPRSLVDSPLKTKIRVKAYYLSSLGDRYSNRVVRFHILSIKGLDFVFLIAALCGAITLQCLNLIDEPSG